MMVWGTAWEFSQDTGVNTPTISAMGSLMTSESGHPFNIPSERRHPTQSSVPNHRPGVLEYCFLDQRKECLLLALQHHFQQHLVSHPGPTLFSFRSKTAVGCRVVCCWHAPSNSLPLPLSYPSRWTWALRSCLTTTWPDDSWLSPVYLVVLLLHFQLFYLRLWNPDLFNECATLALKSQLTFTPEVLTCCTLYNHCHYYLTLLVIYERLNILKNNLSLNVLL
jgi:hypothetical protein